jgi:hypothetical protein
VSHPCPVSGCDVMDVPDDLLTCRQDWRLVPKPLQQAVYRAWDHGRGRGTRAHTAACDAAVRAAENGRGSRPAAEPARPGPHELWQQAGGGTGSYDRDRYLGLLREHGHLLKPGDNGYEAGVTAAGCGWKPPGAGTGDPA